MIVDANVLISALLGTSMPKLIRVRDVGIDLAIPEHQLREVRLILEHKFGRPPEIVAHQLADAGKIVEMVDRSFYGSMEPAARRRLDRAGQRDWPVLAAAMALDRPILSNDRDFFGVGVPVWTPYVLDRELETLDA